MKKFFLLSTLITAICINSYAIASQSDWDSVWQGGEWNNAYRNEQYTNRYNSKQNSQQKSYNEDECIVRKGNMCETKDAIIYDALPDRDLGRWKSWE